MVLPNSPHQTHAGRGAGVSEDENSQPCADRNVHNTGSEHESVCLAISQRHGTRLSRWCTGAEAADKSLNAVVLSGWARLKNKALVSLSVTPLRSVCVSPSDRRSALTPLLLPAEVEAGSAEVKLPSLWPIPRSLLLPWFFFILFSSQMSDSQGAAAGLRAPADGAEPASAPKKKKTMAIGSFTILHFIYLTFLCLPKQNSNCLRRNPSAVAGSWSRALHTMTAARATCVAAAVAVVLFVNSKNSTEGFDRCRKHIVKMALARAGS